jgi:hypothetical protein
MGVKRVFLSLMPVLLGALSPQPVTAHPKDAPLQRAYPPPPLLTARTAPSK